MDHYPGIQNPLTKRNEKHKKYIIRINKRKLFLFFLINLFFLLLPLVMKSVMITLFTEHTAPSLRLCSPIDLHTSKPLISLVPITCPTYYFQGKGHCYVTTPIVCPTNHKLRLEQVEIGPFSYYTIQLEPRLENHTGQGFRSHIRTVISARIP